MSVYTVHCTGPPTNLSWLAFLDFCVSFLEIVRGKYNMAGTKNATVVDPVPVTNFKDRSDISNIYPRKKTKRKNVCCQNMANLYTWLEHLLGFLF